MVMHFHKTKRSTVMCVCYVKNGEGYDAFGEVWRVITDDFGNIVFVK